jgi:hypothetical protein
MRLAVSRLLICLGLIAGVTAMKPNAFAQLIVVGDFEIDGNTPDDTGPGDPIDWDDAYPPTVGRTDFTDAPSGAGDDAFGQGSDQNTPGQWVYVLGGVPNKDDILTGSVAFRGVDTDNNPSTPQEQFVYVKFTRDGNNGSADVDFEFNQSGATYVNSKGTTVPVRTSGDLLIAYDQTGNSAPDIRLFEWAGTQFSGVFNEITLPAGSFAGAVNCSNAQCNGSGDRTFGEAALNLSAAGREICTQFLKVWMKSRSSFSITSALKDRTPQQDVVVCQDLNECTSDVCDPNAATFCSFPPAADSTPCTDTDNSACTTAGCDGAGACDQNHIVHQCSTAECNTGQCDPSTGLCITQPDSTPCTDTDNNACTSAGCESGGTEVSSCVQTHVFAPNSSPCPDTGNECATAGCDGAGNCDQLHVLAPDSNPCGDTDNNACTTAGCNGAGSCDQSHVVKQCQTNECNTGQCNPSTGLCVPQPDSTPCTDTTTTDCFAAGCESGGGEVGTCVQTHVGEPDSTPCPDTDGNVCTTAGCNGAGACDQSHIFVEDSTPCPDTDNNECTTAGCNPNGVCDQRHLTATTQCSQDSRAFGVFVDFPLGESILDLTGPLAPPLNGGPEFIDASPDTDVNGSPAEIACVGPGPTCLFSADPLARVDVLKVEKSGNCGPNGATSSATATTAHADVLDTGGGNFLVTADVVKAVATCSAGTTAAATTDSSDGSVLEHVTVGGQNFDLIREPTTVTVNVPGLGTATVKLLEKNGGSTFDDANNRFNSNLVVNAIHVTVTDGSGNTVLDAIVAHANCSAAFGTTETCAAVPTVSGSGYVVGVDVDTTPDDPTDSPIVDTKVAQVNLPSTGGADDATAKHIGPITDDPPTVTLVESKTAFSHTEGSVAGTSAASSTHSEVEYLQLLNNGSAPSNPLIQVDLARAECTSNTGSGGSSSTGTTTLLKPVIGGTPGGTAICLPVIPDDTCSPAPNTDIGGAPVGTLIRLNEQFCDGGTPTPGMAPSCTGTNASGITVNAIHVFIIGEDNPLGLPVGAEIIVSNAHCDSSKP